MPDQPTQITTNYEPPHVRAMSSATRTATSVLLSLAVVVLPLLVKFLTDATYSRTTLVALASGIGVAVCATLLSYALAYSHATQTDPIYQARRTASLQAKNAMKLQALAIRYGVPAPTPPAAAGYVLTPNAPHA